MKIITKLSELSDFLICLNKYNKVALDTETSGLSPHTCKLYIISCAFEGGEEFVFNCLKLDKEDIKYIVSLLTEKLVVCHNAKFDIKVLQVQTGILLTKLHCTQITETLIHNGLGKYYYSLEELVMDYFYQPLNKDIRETFYNSGELNTLTTEQLQYATEDVRFLIPMMERQLVEINKSRQNKIYDLEMKLIPVVADMELEGMLLDKVAWKKLAVDNKVQLAKLKISIRDTIFERLDLSKFDTLYDFIVAFGLNPSKDFGVKFNIKTKRDTILAQSITDKSTYKDYYDRFLNLNSSHQLLKLLQSLGFDIESTGEEILTKHKDDKIFEMMLEHREIEKLISSFGEEYLTNIHPLTNRIHANFNQTKATTGRFTCDDPNLQQLTKKEGYRECFVAPEGYLFLDIDCSQMEFREAGAISGEPLIIDAYKRGMDMHTATAALLYEVSLDKVEKAQRFDGKTVNFAQLYGSSDRGLAYNMGISLEKAKHILELFWGGYTILAKFKEGVEEQIWKRKYANTVLGRRKYFEDKNVFIDGKEYMKYKTSTLREGFSVVVQGTCSDIIKLSMVKFWYENPFGNNVRLVLQVHDELGFYVKKEIIEEAKVFIQECIESQERIFFGEIPAKTETVVANCWKH